MGVAQAHSSALHCWLPLFYCNRRRYTRVINMRRARALAPQQFVAEKRGKYVETCMGKLFVWKNA